MSSDGLNDMPRLQLVGCQFYAQKMKVELWTHPILLFSREILKRVLALYNTETPAIFPKGKLWMKSFNVWMSSYLKGLPTLTGNQSAICEYTFTFAYRTYWGCFPPTHPQVTYFSYFSPSNTLFSVAYLTFISKENKSKKNILLVINLHLQ